MSSPNYRVIPFLSRGGAQRVVVNGKVVAVANGSFADVPVGGQHIQGVLIAGLVGPTSARPTVTKANDHFIDTTLSKVVYSDGQGNWYDPFTGGVV